LRCNGSAGTGDPGSLPGPSGPADRSKSVRNYVSSLASPHRNPNSPNFVVRLRTAQDSLRRNMLRIYHIQKVQFVPSVHVLVQMLVLAILLMMLFLKTEGAPESAIMFGFISYMFVYALYLVRLLEQPFAKEHASFDDVSLFLLYEFEGALRKPIQAQDEASETRNRRTSSN
jgi:hypothetical protein